MAEQKIEGPGAAGGGGGGGRAAVNAFMSRKTPAEEAAEEVIEELKHIYMTRIRPVEELYKFDEFYSPLLNPVDFDAPPMVLMMGQVRYGHTVLPMGVRAVREKVSKKGRREGRSARGRYEGGEGGAFGGGGGCGGGG
jgi:hypothetical protein